MERVYRICLVGMVVSGLADVAHAQPGLYPASTLDAPPASSSDRSLGLMASATLGRGAMSITCSQCGNIRSVSETVSVSGLIGYRFSSRLAATAELWMMEQSGSYWFGEPLWHTAWRVSGTVGPQLWLSRRWWVRGGLGLSRHWIDPGVETEPVFVPLAQKKEPPGPRFERFDETGLASQLGTGFEIFGDRYFSLDMQVRVGGSMTTDGWVATTASMAFGVSWF